MGFTYFATYIKMPDSRFKRVSRSQPCLICGKPDWCSRLADGSVSFCARVTTGADRVSRKEQWGVFYHDREVGTRRQDENHYKKTKSTCSVKPELKLAPLEIRDFVYHTLFRLSPAGRYKSLTDGAKGLRERGLESHDNYGGLPASLADRKYLATEIRQMLNRNFPSFVRQNPHGIRHVPGFWIDESGEAQVWQTQEFTESLLLIPYRNPIGQIQACQIRFTGELKAKQKRYFWLSLPSRSAGSGTPLHFASWNTRPESNAKRPVLITEGALKADVAARLLPQFFVIANGGVNCSHDLIVQLSRGISLFLAFDNDYKQNPLVARSLAKLLKLRLDDKRQNCFSAATRILVWNESYKGLDDALLQKSDITEISVIDWFTSLRPDCRLAAEQVWSE